MKKKIFVTGATGFVGTNLIRRLIRENYEVHILKRKNSNIWRIKDILTKLHPHEVDLLNRKRLLKLLHTIKPNVVIHLANLGLYGGLDTSLNKSMQVNLFGTVNLIESTDSIDYECFINTGSSSEYGDKNTPMKEYNRCEPTSNYALAKLATTLYAKSYAVKTKKPLVTLRLFSPYGPFDHPLRLIPQTIHKMLKGETIHIKNPNTVRDYIFIEDVIEAFIQCINNPDKLSGEILNIGSGKQTCVKDMLELLTKKVDFKNQIIYDDLKNPQKFMWQANIQKTKQKLKWYPKKNLSQGIEETVNWFKENSCYYD